MELQIGNVVKSKAGHDQGEIFVITGIETEYVLLVDGRHRPVGKPKRKNKKHIQPVQYLNREIAARLSAGLAVRDEEIRRVIRAYSTDAEIN